MRTVIDWKRIDEVHCKDQSTYWLIVDATELKAMYTSEDNSFTDMDGQYTFEPEEIDFIAPYAPPTE